MMTTKIGATAFVMCAFIAIGSPAAAKTVADCSFDKSAMLALDQNKFDQDLNGGWRTVATEGCEEVAADLIRDWRAKHNANDPILFWHEGQLRASVEQYDAAIALFKQSRKTEAEDAGWGWNLYVDGSIAFVEGDKAALMEARKKLAALPKPPGATNRVDIDGNPIEIKWPMNLSVLDGLIRCWGLPYKQAYGCPTELK
jgi:hypothetical protein